MYGNKPSNIFKGKKKEILGDPALLILKRLCQTLQKPLFEIQQYPLDELEWWAAVFSIDDNKDKPLLTYTKKHVTVEQSIADLKRVMS
jgi:hypothetical protein